MFYSVTVVVKQSKTNRKTPPLSSQPKLTTICFGPDSPIRHRNLQLQALKRNKHQHRADHFSQGTEVCRGDRYALDDGVRGRENFLESVFQEALILRKEAPLWGEGNAPERFWHKNVSGIGGSPAGDYGGHLEREVTELRHGIGVGKREWVIIQAVHFDCGPGEVGLFLTASAISVNNRGSSWYSLNVYWWAICTLTISLNLHNNFIR